MEMLLATDHTVRLTDARIEHMQKNTVWMTDPKCAWPSWDLIRELHIYMYSN